jgi:uncharacterized membrane protein YdjX (TVP38/TMEM64 family)
MYLLHHWRLTLLIAVAILAVVAMVMEPAWVTAFFGRFNRDSIAVMVDQAGLWGPFLVVGLMMVAIVASPIPSAPIALAAGVAYGHVWGTVFVLVGAEAGAMIAFALARVLGRETLRRWFGDKLDFGLLGSQGLLMWTVFASRLMPFISFDLVSYAAGLSSLHFWRFAVATLAGIVPASFVLTHFGGEVAGGNMAGATWAVLGLGLITGLPVLWVIFRGKSKK